MTDLSEIVIIDYDGPLQMIKFNIPNKKNALSTEVYDIVREALKHAIKNDNIKITVMTGAGDYFSSGNDFTPPPLVENYETLIENRVDCVREFIRSLIDYPKILIALVNGPAIGIAVTMLPLFDLVYALESATFWTPFSMLAIMAEGCSTYTFSRCLGKSMAAKMLYFNYKMSAQEAKECGFVAEVLTEGDLASFKDIMRNYGKLPLKSLINTKKVIRNHDLQSLHFANNKESEKLVEMFQSQDFIEAMLRKNLSKRSKL